MKMASNLEQKLKELKRNPFVDGYQIKGHLSDGHASKIYRAEKDGKDFVLKVMSPSLFPGRIMYRLFFQERHGYFDIDAVETAFWRRRMVNRLMPYFDKNIEIVDAVEKSQEFPGFYSRFVEDSSASNNKEKEFVLDKVSKLAEMFRDAGLPTWSFDPKYPFFRSRGDNIRINEAGLTIIDYESAVLTPVSEGGWDLDYVNFSSVGKIISESKHILQNELGNEEFVNLEEAFEKCKYFSGKWHEKESRILTKLLSKNEIWRTIDELVSEEKFSDEESVDLKENIVNEKTNYILTNLAVHLGISLTAGVFSGPIPFGLFPRGAWTIGNRVYQELKGNKEKARVHNLGVLAWSSIPIPGLNYFGYMLPLKKENEDFAHVLSEHYTRTVHGKTFREFLDGKPGIAKSLLKRNLIPKSKRELYEK